MLTEKTAVDLHQFIPAAIATFVQISLVCAYARADRPPMDIARVALFLLGGATITVGAFAVIYAIQGGAK